MRGKSRTVASQTFCGASSWYLRDGDSVEGEKESFFGSVFDQTKFAGMGRSSGEFVSAVGSGMGRERG